MGYWDFQILGALENIAKELQKIREIMEKGGDKNGK